jgi:hypothetical protein
VGSKLPFAFAGKMLKSHSRDSSRVSILLYGLVHRGLRHTVDSIREHVIAPLRARGRVHLYFHSWDTARLHNPRAGEEAEIDVQEIAQLIPESRGGVDSESDFDRSVDWKQLELRNSTEFRQTTIAGKVTFRNIVRTLESLERVWQLFNMIDDGDGGLVIATRADVRFLEPLPLDSLRDDSIGIPSFHGWGGVNDRFAIGSRQQMGIYCQRRRFYEESLDQSHLRNPESVLAAWLEENHVPIQLMDFNFQRIRADGQVASRDLEIGYGGNGVIRAIG